MKKLILAVLISTCAIFAQAQQAGIYLPGTVPAYGTHVNRILIDTALLFPTGCGAPNSLKWHSNDSSHAAKYFDSCNNKEYTWNPKRRVWSWILDSVSASVSTAGNADSLQHIIGTNYILYGGTGIVTGSSTAAITAGSMIDKIIFYDPSTISISIGTALNSWNVSPRFYVTGGSYTVIQLSKYFLSSGTLYFNGVTSNTIIKIYKL